MNLYSLTERDIELMADTIKTTVVKSLVKDGFLDENEADEWCAKNGLVVRQKTIFQTITDRWKKEPELKGLNIFVVRLK